MALPYRWQVRLDKLRNSLRGIFGGSDQQPRPKLCPACGALVGISATRCHECGTSLRFSLAALGKSFGGIISAEAPVTYVIFVINILLFVVSILATNKQGGESFNLFGGVSGHVLLQFGAQQSLLVFSGEWWRLVMPIFLHLGLLHFGMNTMVLLDFGPRVESTYGSPRFLFLYLFTGIFGNVASAAWSMYWRGGYGLSAGASGALCGLLGLLLATTIGNRSAQARETRSQLVRMLIYLVALGLFFAVDNAAHFGGLASGFVFGKLFAERLPMNQKEVKRAYALGFVAGIVVIASFTMMFLHLKDFSGG